MNHQIKYSMQDYLDGTDLEGDPPVALMVVRTIRPENREAYERFVKGTIAVAGQFEGYLGTSVFRPNGKQQTVYRLILRFDHVSSLKRWERSSVRQQWLHKLEVLADEPPQINIVSGLDTWFDCLGSQVVTAPPRYKMAVLIWLAIYPLISLLLFLLGPWINDFPLLFKTAVLTLLAVPVMTYFIMPRLTFLFADWLQANEEELRHD